MKRKANFIKFYATYRRIAGETSPRILEVARRQFTLLSQGIRDVRVSDTAIFGWSAGGGQW